MGFSVLLDMDVDVDEQEETNNINPTFKIKINLEKLMRSSDGVDSAVGNIRSEEVKIKDMQDNDEEIDVIDVIDVVEDESKNMLSCLGVPVSYRDKIIDHILADVVDNLGPPETQVSFKVTAHVTIIQREEDGDTSNEEDEENNNKTDDYENEAISNGEEEDNNNPDDYDIEGSEYEVYFDSDNELNNNGAPEHLIDELKKEVYNGEDGEYGCTICTDILVCQKSQVIRCPSTHTFHSGCLINWLLVSDSCPVCRRPVVNIKSD